MNRAAIHVAAAGLVGASLVLLQPAVAFGQVSAHSVRTRPPAVVQHAVTRARPHRILNGTVLNAAPAPLPQAPIRSRTLPGSVPALSNSYSVSAQQALINQDRLNNGNLSPLAWNACLANVALQNAQRIAAQGYLSHTNGPTLDLACDSSFTTAGENIAYISSGPNDPQANTMFMNSAPHRANILNGAYRFVATAWVTAPNGYGYIAVEFAG